MFIRSSVLSVFELRSLMGAASSKIRSQQNEIDFLKKCDLADTKEMLFARQALALAEAEAAIVHIEYLSAISVADAQGVAELRNAAVDAQFPVAA
jgi:hypothetical protein